MPNIKEINRISVYRGLIENSREIFDLDAIGDETNASQVYVNFLDGLKYPENGRDPERPNGLKTEQE